MTIISIADALFAVLTIVLALPAGVFTVECLAALLPERRSRTPPLDTPPKVAVLVPAHNESAGIVPTIKSLKEALPAGQRLIIIADNCTDDTADLARAEGTEVIERTNPDERGKGYALVFGVQHLSADPPDVVVVVDADCRVTTDTIEDISRTAHALGRPVQADYIIAPPKKTPTGAISGLAILVKNLVRPRGLRQLGLPCQLLGSGMAFPWDVLVNLPPTGSYLVEDMLMGIEAALMGHPPLSSAYARVESLLPEGNQAAIGQRRRWEHGHLTTMLHGGPRLIMAGLTRFNVHLLAQGLDLLVPPMALLVTLLLFVTLSGGALVLLGAPGYTLGLSGSALAGVTGATFIAWARFGRKDLPFRFLLTVPFYLLWKVPLYLAFFMRRGQKTWQRTERDTPKDTSE